MKIKEIIELLNSKIDSNKIEIPEYQREYVWDGTNNVSNLLESFIKGYPVGSILTWVTTRENDKGENESVTVLIDGLQRSFSINSIRSMPLKHITWEIIVAFSKLKNVQINLESEDDFRKFSQKMNRSILNTNEWNILNNKINKENDLNKKISILGEKCLYSDFEKIEILKNKYLNQNGLNSFEKIVDQYIDWCEGDGEDEFGSIDINRIKMPSSLTEKDIPEVFERINSNGKKLSNYEINSSTWASNKIVLDEVPEYVSDFIDERKKRYQNSLNVKKINILESNKNDFNPSTIIYAIFNEVLNGNPFMKNIFMSSGVINDINTMSYIIAFYLRIESTKKFKDIGLRLKERIDGKKVNLELMVSELKNHFEKVSDSLKMFTFLSNQSGTEEISFQKIKVSEHLIVSFINTLIRLEQEGESEDTKINTRENFKFWFIIEGLDSSYGNGTGNAAWEFAKKKKYVPKFEIEEDEDWTQEQLDAIRAEKFAEAKEEIKKKLNEKSLIYLNEEKNKGSMKTYSKQAVLLLAIIQFDSENIVSIKNHVDHIIPKSNLLKIKNLTKDIHSIFNLQLLDPITNMKKNNSISVQNKQWDWLISDDIMSDTDQNRYLKKLAKFKDNPSKDFLPFILDLRETYYKKLLENKISKMK